MPKSQVWHQHGCATAFDLREFAGSTRRHLRVCVDHELRPFRDYMGDERLLAYLERGAIRAAVEGRLDGSQLAASEVYVFASDARLYGP